MQKKVGHGYVGSEGGSGQSSSVMLDQNIHTMITDRRVKRVSKRAPLIFRSDAVQRWVLTTY